MGIVERFVRPEREMLRGGADALRRRKRWWLWSRETPALYSNLSNIDNCIATAYTSPHLSFSVVSASLYFLNTVVIFAYPNLAPFTVLQSRVHEVWARVFSSTLEDRLRYAPSDCFETFPFPPGYETNPTLEATGQTYHDHRAVLMVAANEGMTKTYNQFHDSEKRGEPIRRLRDLHDEMDRAVLRVYGWHDLADELRPEFLTEETEDDHTYQGRYFWPSEARDRVLARLLALNAQRHKEEVAAGLVEPQRKAKASEDADEQQGLALDEE
jgi:hypothetical protein